MMLRGSAERRRGDRNGPARGSRDAVPELPEVETMARGLRAAVEGRTIASCEACPCACRPIALAPPFPLFAQRVAGTSIETVRRVAKRVVLDLSSGDSIAVEPRMTGLMLLADPPDRDHLRLRWDFADARPFPTLWFWDRRGLGTVTLSSRAELDAMLAERLGRDALDMSLADWSGLCATARRAIKVALLDQSRVAGIGNLYASEILHLAGIHPERLAVSLKAAEVARLHAAVRDVLTDAIACEGSTLGDATYRTALSVNGAYQNRHRVYKKADEPCRTCGKGPILRIVQAQRATFYCPTCQPAGGRRRQGSSDRSPRRQRRTRPS